MASPHLQKKTEEKLTVSDCGKQIFQVIYREQKQALEKKQDEEIPKIKVSRLISKMSFYYEKIRNTVDYKDEHLLRKNAIERILRRQIIIERAIKQHESRDISRHLLTELIRAAYLPNNEIPEAKIDEIGAIIKKYAKLREGYEQSLKNGGNADKRGEIIRWIIALAASDIERNLGYSPTDRTVVNNMYKILLDSIRLPDDTEYGKDKDIQVYVGIYRSFLKYDRDMLSFIIFKYYNSGWEHADEDEAGRIGKNLELVKEAIDHQIDHPLARQLDRIISRYTVFFTILTDVVDDDPVTVYDQIRKDPKAFPRLIKQKCANRYQKVRSKLWRAAVRSIFYIFITKSIFVVILEVPATRWFGEVINPVSLFINITFPAILLFLIVFFTRLPGEDNTGRIVEGIDEIMFEERKRTDQSRLRAPAKRSRIKNTIFGLVYTFTFFLSFGLVVWALGKIKFNIVSIIIFLFFLALVSFFSIRVRKGTKELLVVEPKENIMSLFVDFFYTPIVAVGKWLSENFSRINVFVFILDFIIEAPFKIFVEVAEEWTRYVRERKEEIM